MREAARISDIPHTDIPPLAGHSKFGPEEIRTPDFPAYGGTLYLLDSEGIEPSTSCLQSKRSAVELRARN